MALKQIPFSLEMVKKIQSGEIKGTMQTLEGVVVRFLGEIKHTEYPLVFVRTSKHTDNELLETYTLTGRYNIIHAHENDIILGIETSEEEKQEYQFKPFDKVLVRDLEDEKWKADFFSRYYTDYLYDYECVSGAYIQYIPYEGNEHLLGTNNKPKEE